MRVSRNLFQLNHIVPVMVDHHRLIFRWTAVAAAAALVLATVVWGEAGLLAGIAVVAIVMAAGLWLRVRYLERKLATLTATSEVPAVSTGTSPPQDVVAPDAPAPAGPMAVAALEPAALEEAVTGPSPHIASFGVLAGTVSVEPDGSAATARERAASEASEGESAPGSGESSADSVDIDPAGTVEPDRNDLGTAVDLESGQHLIITDAAPDQPAQMVPTPEPRPEPVIPVALPEFALPALSGDTLTTAELADPSGRPAVVVFWRPGCAPSVRLTPELVAWESLQGPRLVVFAACDAPTAWRAGLPGTVVLDTSFSVGHALGAAGTPAALSIDAEGRPVSPVVAGASAVTMHLFDAMRAWASDDAEPDPVSEAEPEDETLAAYGPPVPPALLVRRLEPLAAGAVVDDAALPVLPIRRVG